MNTLFRNLFIFLAMSATWAQAAEPAHDHSHGAATPVANTASAPAPVEAPSPEACPMMQGGKPGMGGMMMMMPANPGMGPRGMMAGGESCPMHSSGAMSCPKHEAMQQRMKAVERRLDALERAAKSATPSATK